MRANVRGFVGSVEAGKILLSFWGRLSSDAETRRLNAKLYAKYRRRCAKLVVGLVDDADAVAALLVGMVIGIATQHYFDPGAIEVQAATEVAEEMIAARFGRRRAKAS